MTFVFENILCENSNTCRLVCIRVSTDNVKTWQLKNVSQLNNFINLPSAEQKWIVIASDAD